VFAFLCVVQILRLVLENFKGMFLLIGKKKLLKDFFAALFENVILFVQRIVKDDIFSQFCFANTGLWKE
jgi:hypothetical protein